MIVLDTHILLWFFQDHPLLPAALKSRLEADPTAALVPSICFWEAMMLSQAGRIDLGSNHPDQEIKRLVHAAGFNEAPLTSEIALLSRTLEFNHNDPADRFIAATSYSLNAPLATLDQHLRRLPWLKLAI